MNIYSTLALKQHKNQRHTQAWVSLDPFKYTISI